MKAMRSLTTIDPPFALDTLAQRIRASSNFRFEWQFYAVEGYDIQLPNGVRSALDAIIATPELHRFLRDSFERLYAPEFAIEPLHEHCRIDATTGHLENVLAAGAGDRLGAYSTIHGEATIPERNEIEKLFAGFDEYHAFELRPGDEQGCATCREYNHHVFSTWFYGVAWDWCLFATWPERKVMWMGCLSDTD